MTAEHPDAQPGSNPHGAQKTIVFIACIFIPALILRLPLVIQSLWYDEMYTLTRYVAGTWADVISGTYIPNNHILFTLLAKAANELLGGSDPITAIRLPSILAGSLVGVVLAWPEFQRGKSGVAIAIGLMISLHPWLLSISGQARGYALLLLLACLATLLFSSRRWKTYTVCVAALLYTHPIGIGILVGHGIIMLHEPKSIVLRNWLISVFAAGLFASLLYFPMFRSIRAYWLTAHPTAITSYGSFIIDSIGHAISGRATESHLFYCTIAALLGVAGSLILWRKSPAYRDFIVTFSGASLFGLLVPVLVPAAGESRALIWLIPPVCLGAYGLLLAASDRLRQILWIGLFISLALLSASVWRLPVQPIREAVDLANLLADKGQPIVGVYLGAAETRAVYGLDAVAYQLDSTPGIAGLRDVEQQSGRQPVLISIFDQLMQRDQLRLWEYINANYDRHTELYGREGNILIYTARTRK